MTTNTETTRRVLSLDVGIKNLSFADVLIHRRGETHENDAQDLSTETTLDLVGWGVLDVSSADAKGLDALCMRLLAKLREQFFDSNGTDDAYYDYVLIENQPVVKNPVMKTIQIIAYTFFQTTKQLFGCVGEVRLMSASQKLKAHGGGAGLTYAQKKELAVKCCREALTETEKPTQIIRVGEATRSARLAQLDGSRKKDDLADCFLQATAFCRQQGWFPSSSSSS